jgi:hypothetical protein
MSNKNIISLKLIKLLLLISSISFHHQKLQKLFSFLFVPFQEKIYSKEIDAQFEIKILIIVSDALRMCEINDKVRNKMQIFLICLTNHFK